MRTRFQRAFALCIAAIHLAGCTRIVNLSFQPPREMPPYVSPSAAPEKPLKVFLREVKASPEASTDIGGGAVKLRWSEDQRAALEGEWEKDIRGQRWMGQFVPTERQSDCAMSLATSYHTTWRTNGWMVALGAAVFLGSVGVGFGVGYAIDPNKKTSATTGNTTGSTATIVGGVIGEVAGVLIAMALPTREHEHTWTTDIEVWDRANRRFFKKRYARSESYSTSVYTDTEGRHSSRISTLFAVHERDVLAALDKEMRPELEAYAAEPHQREPLPAPTPPPTAPVSVAAAVRQMKLAVMAMQDQSGAVEARLLDNLTDYVRGRLAATGRFLVIDKTRQEAALKTLVKREKACSYNPQYAEQCQIPLGQELAADSILRLWVTRIGSYHVFQAEIVDLAKAASVGGATARSKVDPAEGREDRMMEALETLVRDLGGGTSGKVEPQ